MSLGVFGKVCAKATSKKESVWTVIERYAGEARSSMSRRQIPEVRDFLAGSKGRIDLIGARAYR